MGGLAVIRALGPLGFRITALTPDPSDFAVISRYVEEVAVCPPPSDEAAFVRYLLERRDAWCGALILETEDAYTSALGRRKDELVAAGYRVLAPHWEQSRWFLDKHRTHALAESLAVPQPALHRLRPSEPLEGVIDELSFPVVVKPVRTPEFSAAFGVKLWAVAGASELRERLQLACRRGIDVFVQEVIPGTDEGSLESVEVYINRDGSWGCDQYNVKVRQAPPMWGVMRVGRSVPVIEDVREHTRRLLEAVEYRGYASAEFKRDPRDGQAKLIEVNARLPRNGELALASGTNFPYLIHRDIVEGVPSEAQPLRPTWFIDVVADIGTTVVRDRSQVRRPVALLRPYLAPRKTLAALSIRDPRPFAALVGGRFRKHFRSVPGRAGGRWGADGHLRQRRRRRETFPVHSDTNGRGSSTEK